jgi:hypothetical protein
LEDAAEKEHAEGKTHGWDGRTDRIGLGERKEDERGDEGGRKVDSRVEWTRDDEGVGNG